MSSDWTRWVVAGCLAGLAVTAPALALGGSALSGQWTSPVGLIGITQEGERVTGRLLGDSQVCPFAKGREVLAGSLLDDNVTGNVTLCYQGEGCSGEAAGFALLLVGAGGVKLAGAVSVPARAGCAVPGRGQNGGVTFLKMGDEAPTPAAAAAGAVPGAGTKKKKKAKEKDASAQAPTARKDKKEDPAAAAARREKANEHLRRGEQLLHAGSFKQARDEFRAAIDLTPDRAEAYNGVGVTYYATKLLDEAMTWYKQAIEANPDFGDAYYNMACLHALKSEKPQALRYLRIAVLNGYTEFGQMKEDPDLANLQGDKEFEDLAQGRF